MAEKWQWKRYSQGLATLTMYDENQEPFTGSYDEWITVHGQVSGYSDKGDRLVLLNSRNEIAAVGAVVHG